VTTAQAPLIKVGEVILIAAVVFHGLNGLRLTFLAFGMGIRYQKILFVAITGIAVLVTLLFAIHLFGA